MMRLCTSNHRTKRGYPQVAAISWLPLRGILQHSPVEIVAEFGRWGHDGHSGGHFERSYLSVQPSTNFAALLLGILVSLSGVLPLKDVGPPPR
jgi:hypothetical protein